MIQFNVFTFSFSDSIMIDAPLAGFPYKCFTFFSLIDEPNKDPENLSLSDCKYIITYRVIHIKLVIVAYDFT